MLEQLCLQIKESVSNLDLDSKVEAINKLREAMRKVIDVAIEKTRHVYAGHCPDSTQPDMRDETCIACQAIMEAERTLAQPPAPEQQAPQVGEATRVAEAMLAASPAAPEAAKPETVGINGLTDAETSATASVIGLVKPETGLAARLLAHADAHSSVSPYDQEQQDWENDLRKAAALLAADSKAGGEPVAWLYTAHDGHVQAFTNEPPLRLKELCTPLYTRPQQQAKQLTEEKRGFMVLEHLGPAALTGGTMSIYDAFMLGIDATEAEHGIRKDQA